MTLYEACRQLAHDRRCLEADVRCVDGAHRISTEDAWQVLQQYFGVAGLTESGFEVHLPSKPHNKQLPTEPDFSGLVSYVRDLVDARLGDQLPDLIKAQIRHILRAGVGSL